MRSGAIERRHLKKRHNRRRDRATPRALVGVLVRVALTIASGCAMASPLDDLAGAIATRLSLMDDVARYKWNHSLPIVDEQREAKLVERATAQAVTLGVPADYARRVVVAQIEASRARQAELTTQWRAQHHARLRRCSRSRDGAAPCHRCGHHEPAAPAARGDVRTRFGRRACGVRRSAGGARGREECWSTATAALWPAPDC